MATDWSARQPALEHMERMVKLCQRMGDVDVEHYRQAVNALRRSQDHTAIQTKLSGATKALRDIDKEIAACHPDSNTSALALWTLLTVVRAIVQSQLGKRDE